MTDLAHTWSGDLSVSPTGDIAVVTGTLEGQQRVLRRLLTNAGDYLWHLAYGAGLPQRVGQVASASRIRATIRRQIFKEAAVSASPAPVISVAADQTGVVFVSIQYADAITGEPSVLSFPVQPHPVVA